MAENPTTSEILKLRRDLSKYVDAIGGGATIDLYAAEANAQVKRDLRDNHGIKWSMVYDDGNSAYFTDTDGLANNADRIKNMIALLSIGYTFRDYSIAISDSQWWDLSQYYMNEYKEALTSAKLDVDTNESGVIDEGEEQQSQQTFMSR